MGRRRPCFPDRRARGGVTPKGHALRRHPAPLGGGGGSWLRTRRGRRRRGGVLRGLHPRPRRAIGLSRAWRGHGGTGRGLAAADRGPGRSRGRRAESKVEFDVDADSEDRVITPLKPLQGSPSSVAPTAGQIDADHSDRRRGAAADRSRGRDHPRRHRRAFTWDGTSMRIFDTAGMRKKARIQEKLEEDVGTPTGCAAVNSPRSWWSCSTPPSPSRRRYLRHCGSGRARRARRGRRGQQMGSRGDEKAGQAEGAERGRSSWHWPQLRRRAPPTLHAGHCYRATHRGPGKGLDPGIPGGRALLKASWNVLGNRRRQPYRA